MRVVARSAPPPFESVQRTRRGRWRYHAAGEFFLSSSTPVGPFQATPFRAGGGHGLEPFEVLLTSPISRPIPTGTGMIIWLIKQKWFRGSKKRSSTLPDGFSTFPGA